VDALGRELWRAQLEVVGLSVPDAAHEQALLEARRVEPFGERSHLERWAAHVHARDHAHHTDRTHRASLTTERQRLLRGAVHPLRYD
jgi:hypothetical protein